jgi:hypothetical protein
LSLLARFLITLLTALTWLLRLLLGLVVLATMLAALAWLLITLLAALTWVLRLLARLFVRPAVHLECSDRSGLRYSLKYLIGCGSYSPTPRGRYMFRRRWTRTL